MSWLSRARAVLLSDPASRQVRTLLEARDQPTRLRAIDDLGRLATPRAVGALAAFVPADRGLAIRAVLALSAIPGSLSQHATLRFLSSLDPAVVRTACEVLGFSGSRTSVPALRAVEQAMSTPAEVRAAARAAIQRIEARRGDHRGGLSMAAEPGAGELSLAAPGGALSLEGTPGSDG